MCLACLWSWMSVTGGLAVGTIGSPEFASFVFSATPVFVAAVLFLQVAAVGKRLPFARSTAALGLWGSLGGMLVVAGQAMSYAAPWGLACLVGLPLTAYALALLLDACVFAMAFKSNCAPLLLVGVSFLLQALLSIVVVASPVEVRLVCEVALPAVAALSLQMLPSASPSVGAGTGSSNAETPPLSRMCLGIFAYSFVMMAVWYLIEPPFDLVSHNQMILVRSIGVVVALAVLLVAEILAQLRRATLLSVMAAKVVLFVILIGVACGVVLFPLIGVDAGVIDDAANFLFQTLVFASVIKLARCTGASSHVLLGSMVGTLLLAQVCAQVVSAALLHPLLDVVGRESLGVTLMLLAAGASLFVVSPPRVRSFSLSNAGKTASPDSVQEAARPAQIPWASAFGLTPREIDVAELLVRGRSLPAIQERLCISEGTVKTHLRHIYEKMQVHTKQEFLDKAESYAFHDGREEWES